MHVQAANAALALRRRLLALCAALAGALPLRRAEEPLQLLHVADGLVAKRGAEVLASLKAALAAGSAPGDAKVQLHCCHRSYSSLSAGALHLQLELANLTASDVMPHNSISQPAHFWTL